MHDENKDTDEDDDDECNECDDAYEDDDDGHNAYDNDFVDTDGGNDDGNQTATRCNDCQTLPLGPHGFPSDSQQATLDVLNRPNPFLFFGNFQ